ncbi:ABC transporter ATP-binding protein [[Mycoplasma] collis]|uniref:ABC transporter ATP-binding protein n=1 Tax=[Mycoplasma] collis TaxID=2127 RepID=UPI00068DB55B|nr:ABC transporter ATP-binding protein [[Mycoplasma] collis]
MFYLNSFNKKMLWKLSYGYRKLILVTLIMVLFETAVNVVIPLFVSYMINEGIQVPVENNKQIGFKTDIYKVLQWGIIIILMSLIGLFFGVFSGITSAKASAGMGKNFRQVIFYKVNNLSIENINKFSIATLLNRMTNDSVNIVNAFNQSLRIIVRGPLMLLLSLSTSIILSPKLSLMFVVMIPFVILIFSLTTFFSIPLFKKMLKKYDDFNFKIKENLEGIKTIKSFVNEDQEMEKVKTKINDLTKINIIVERIISLTGPLFFLIIFIAVLFLGSYGSLLVLNNNLQLGTLFSFTSYIFQVSGSVIMIMSVINMIIMAIPSYKRIKEILIEKPAMDLNPEGIKLIEKPKIEFQDVSFKYNANSSNNLKNINLKIIENQTIGIIGPTASGKSTLISLIARLYDVNNGNILIDNINIKNYDLNSLRKQISVVLQKNILFNGTVRENIQVGNLNASDEEIIKALKIANIYNFVENKKEKLDFIIDKNGSNLSGGQKQRITIARALISKPKILILDDATSAIDAKTESMIQNSLKNEIKDCTKIIISQKISSIINADEIFIIDQGKIIAKGNHDYLLKNNEFYQELYNTQINLGGISE